MNGCIGGLCQLLIGRSGHEDIGRLHADLEFVEIVVLQDTDMVETGLHHRVGARFAVFLKQVLFQRPGIHADPDGTAVILGRLHHFGHALAVTDIARVDPQAGRTGLCRLDGALVVEMYIRNDRHRAFAHDLFQGLGGRMIGGGNPDDIRPYIRRALDLGHCCRDIRRIGVRHRLNRYRGAPTYRNIADHDLAAFAAVDIAPRAHGIVGHVCLLPVTRFR